MANTAGRRVKTQPGQHWYATKAWKVARFACLKKAGFTCQWPGCGRVESDTSKLVADHKVPHRGDRVLFFDPDNHQCLCIPCHDGPKQAQDRKLYGMTG